MRKCLVPRETNPGDGSCSTGVTAVCGVGKYQVLFGMFVTGDQPNLVRPAALIAQFVDVR